MRGRGRGLSDRREDRGSHYREEDRETSVSRESREKKKESHTERETSHGGPGERKSQPRESDNSGAKPQRQTQPRKGKEGGEGAKPLNGTPPAPASASKDTNGTAAPKKIDDEKVNNSRRK